jgi:hypothetical protein
MIRFSPLLLSVWCICVVIVSRTEASRLKREAQAIKIVPRDEAGQAISQVSTRLPSGQLQHQDRISFKLTIYGKDYTLDLERNKGLVTLTIYGKNYTLDLEKNKSATS